MELAHFCWCHSRVAAVRRMPPAAEPDGGPGRRRRCPDAGAGRPCTTCPAAVSSAGARLRSSDNDLEHVNKCTLYDTVRQFEL